MTHKEKILTYLRSWQPSFVSSVEIEKQASEWNARPSTIGRRMRELANEGKIERQMMGKLVWYRITGQNELSEQTRQDEQLRVI
jgi:hypothetical protein